MLDYSFKECIIYNKRCIKIHGRMCMNKVFIDGSAGTTGLRIVERLSARDDLEIVKISEENRKILEKRAEAANSADLVFLCLPDAAAKEIVPLIHKNVKICDTSTAHRTADGWVYGFAEIANRRDALKTATRTAVPGCHASGFISLAAPLVEMDILPKNAQVSAYSLTGYTGGGKSMIAAYEDGSRPISYDAPRAYGLSLKHKHLPEMKAVSGLEHAPLFSPIVADFPCGMAVSIPLFKSMVGGADGKTVADALAQYYKGEAGIKVHALGEMPQDGFLSSNMLAGTDKMELFIFESDEQILLTSVFDNLGKGSSGAAIQCMNIMLGLDERKGLE